jgi:type I restriction enzyme S subunit
MKPGYKQTEVGVIPEEWEVKPLGEIGEALIGLTYKPTDVRQHGTLVLRSSNIQNDALAFDDNVFVDAAIPERIRVLNDDVLICVRNGSRDLIGKSALLDDRTKGMTFGAFMAVYRSQIGRLASYLFQSAILKRQINEHLGATINQITNKSINSFRIPVPTPPEQRAIAAALSDVDGLLGGLDRLIAKKRDLKQAAMQQLLTGQTRLPGFHGEWEVKRLRTLLRFQVGFPFSSAFFNEKGEGIRLVKNRDLKSDDQVFHYNGKYEEAFVVHDGDVLIGMDGDFLPCQWNKGPALLNQRVGRVVPNSGFNVAFAFYALIAPLKDIEIVTSSTTVKHLSHGDVEGIERPLPELPEQTAIASVLTEMDAELAALTQRREKTRALKQAMMQELLTGRTRLI